ncbi:MAG: hypothetical protein DRJ31_06845 [Candidatus Methanomethylicota archaeon]|uniref:Uncharacterized protein n=1 Tax=Thermoproteota archaeon TaxID=2056631 RepID=A0A497EPY9_9CREN|nr:MAG: hypothetical protein DRJ31_06845 [Candidatus Verstraetearchaeota archaeon]
MKTSFKQNKGKRTLVTRELSLKTFNMLLQEIEENSRSWPGDVKLVPFKITKAKQKGSKPKTNSRNAVKNTITDLSNLSL